jgi:hypothetical protein
VQAFDTNRLNLLIATILAAAAVYLPHGAAQAAGIDASETMKTPPQIDWKPNYNYPPGTAETSVLFGDPAAAGQYFLLVRIPWLHERAT